MRIGLVEGRREVEGGWGCPKIYTRNEVSGDSVNGEGLDGTMETLLIVWGGWSVAYVPVFILQSCYKVRGRETYPFKLINIFNK